MVTILLALGLACTGTTELEAGSVEVQIESDAGDVIGLVVHYPSTTRYPEGAPVLVLSPGSWEARASAEPSGHEGLGWVAVEVLLPGGVHGELASSGTYDYRGAASIEALRAAVRYAAGPLSEDLPVPLAQLPPVVMGRSNGGNLALAALAELEDTEVGALVQWESPIGDQLASLELNDNSFYEPGTCQATTCPWPGLEGALAFDPGAETWALGIPRDSLGPWPGLFYLDLDGDGAWAEGEKTFHRMAVGPDEGRLHPSVELSASLERSGLTLPAWLASAGEVDAYWAERDGSRHVAAVHEVLPELLVFVAGSAEDHLQSTADHPHVFGHLAAWLGEGHGFARLNADAVYLSALTGLAEAELPDCPAQATLGWPEAEACLVPEELEDLALDELAIRAAVAEAMDRLYTHERSEDLEEILWSHGLEWSAQSE